MTTQPHSEKVRHLRGVNVSFHFEGSARTVIEEAVYFTVVSKKTSETEVEYKVSYCSPRDQFVKKEGIAVARASDKTYTVAIREGDGFKDINFAILTDLVKNRVDAPNAHAKYLSNIFNSFTQY